ncbi:hypothetical protein [Mucilaginibacter sp. 10I4]|uniref:hypothetical protein n=1 Tax=Mucilaginibacter sp. 10I4 TaxID=3048580 RepID=UPI002B22BE7C|nr:hypothetical protein [Mucilaginibacter sp. 10I4]MEB0262906.1 hypothetical protein [Mucilaginibacter sp. 10I4]
MKNQNIASTVISSRLMVSTDIIYHKDELIGDYYQYETWVLSADKRVKSDKEIHGTCQKLDNVLLKKATNSHNGLVLKLTNLLKSTYLNN